MKICIPTETDAGKTARVYGHFGSAPYFTIYDTEKDILEVINNSNQHHTHGTCHPTTALADKNVDVVICGGMGARAVQGLKQAGITVLKASGQTVEEIIKQSEQGLLREITIADACRQHNCHY